MPLPSPSFDDLDLDVGASAPSADFGDFFHDESENSIAALP